MLQSWKNKPVTETERRQGHGGTWGWYNGSNDWLPESRGEILVAQEMKKHARASANSEGEAWPFLFVPVWCQLREEGTILKLLRVFPVQRQSRGCFWSQPQTAASLRMVKDRITGPSPSQVGIAWGTCWGCGCGNGSNCTRGKFLHSWEGGRGMRGSPKMQTQGCLPKLADRQLLATATITADSKWE